MENVRNTNGKKGDNYYSPPVTYPAPNLEPYAPTTPIPPIDPFPVFPDPYKPSQPFLVPSVEPVKCPECGVWWRGYEHRCSPLITTNNTNFKIISIEYYN
jgi:hypothetical protein